MFKAYPVSANSVKESRDEDQGSGGLFTGIRLSHHALGEQREVAKEFRQGTAAQLDGSWLTEVTLG